MKCSTKRIAKLNLVLDFLTQFKAIEFKNTDEQGWIARKLGCTRIQAIKLIHDAREFAGARECAENDATPVLETPARRNPASATVGYYKKNAEASAKNGDFEAAFFSMIQAFNHLENAAYAEAKEKDALLKEKDALLTACEKLLETFKPTGSSWHSYPRIFEDILAAVSKAKGSTQCTS
jgi:hypothetical protein